MSQIFVVTHNGKPVSEGGLRTGYVVDGNTFFDLRGNPPVALAQSAATPKVSEAPKRKEWPLQRGIDPGTGVILYYFLPKALTSKGMCSRCGQTPNTTCQNILTSSGLRELIVCSDCDQIMRPFESVSWW